MFSQSLLLGTGIGILSTGLYATFTSNQYNNNEDRKNEYISIFCIILFVSVIILFLFHTNSESLVQSNINQPSSIIGGGKPPF
tara:strand:+ start:78 stop:326 length:249 start_codon:yes stop_codon:yes gene_type:complete